MMWVGKFRFWEWKLMIRPFVWFLIDNPASMSGRMTASRVNGWRCGLMFVRRRTKKGMKHLNLSNMGPGIFLFAAYTKRVSYVAAGGFECTYFKIVTCIAKGESSKSYTVYSSLSFYPYLSAYRLAPRGSEEGMICVEFDGPLHAHVASSYGVWWRPPSCGWWSPMQAGWLFRRMVSIHMHRKRLQGPPYGSVPGRLGVAFDPDI